MTYGLLIMAFIHFRKYNDEFLFLPLLFFLSTGINRLNAVLDGKAEWVSVVYTRNIFTPMTTEKAMVALGFLALGTVLLFFSYQYFNSRLPYPPKYVDNQSLFDQFIQSQKGFILGLFIFFNIVFTIFKGLMSGPMALGQSYFLLFPMALGGLILLAFLVYKSYNWQDGVGIKIFYLFLMSYAVFMSYNPGQRFQFLSWLIALGILISKNMTIQRKTITYLLGGIFVLFFFSLAGVARKYDITQMSIEEMWQKASERSDKNEDQNMLDGMMMIMDVYPQHLDYAYGMEHFEILLRPIPRQLWPGKPMGSYINKLGLSDARKGTIGISPSIYGTFYAECGIWGIVFFSLVYGWGIARLFRYSCKYNSDIQWLIKGLIIASFIPILRGGDLPGIFAFIGMSFWPVFILLYRYNKYLKQINAHI